MNAETWEKLNGTGWGDEPAECSAAGRQVPCGNSLPQSATLIAPSSEGALEIPGFMYETTQSVLVPAAAWRAQGVGRVKREEHRREKQVRHVVNGVFWCLVGFGIFALILYLGDKICG